jgi:prephenate dehydrogenase
MKIAIIGGAGKMGRWSARFLQQEGNEIVISGRTAARLEEAGRELGVAVASNVDAVEGVDAVVLSVPIEAFERVAAEIGPHIRLGQVVVDITSIKALPVGVMHRYLSQALVLGIHPMFGPGAAGIANQNFVLTPTSEAEEALAREVKTYLETRGAKVSTMTPQEHDDKMAIVLGLSHFVAIVCGDTLLSSNKLKPAGAMGGVTYKVLLTLVESVISENPELYASIQMNLPGTAEMEALFLDKVRDWAELVKNKNRAGFVRRMKLLKEKLEKDNPDFGRAYQNMYRLASEL